MFDRFTSGARTVVELAQAEAKELRHGTSAPSTSCWDFSARSEASPPAPFGTRA